MKGYIEVGNIKTATNEYLHQNQYCQNKIQEIHDERKKHDEKYKTAIRQFLQQYSEHPLIEEIRLHDTTIMIILPHKVAMGCDFVPYLDSLEHDWWVQAVDGHIHINIDLEGGNEQ